MQTRKLLVGSIAALLLAAVVGMAAQNSTPADVPLWITVVLNEYNGGKRVTSLPYVMRARASAGHPRFSSLEAGVRVPIRVKQGEIQFEDVGTHIDCTPSLLTDGGTFALDLGVRYSAIYAPGPNSNKSVPWHPGEPLAQDPIFGGFSGNVRGLVVHDGQTVEAMTAADPVSGDVWKVEVTLSVAK